MSPDDLTLPEVIDVLHRAYLQDRGRVVEPVEPGLRRAFAEYFRGDDDAQEYVLDMWTDEHPEIDLDEADAWLEGFVGSSQEGQE